MLFLCPSPPLYCVNNEHDFKGWGDVTSGCGRFAWNFIVKTVAVAEAEAELVVVVDVAVAQSLEGRGGGVL